MSRGSEVPDWETLLAHAARLQTKIPGAVLVGGTAAALHARHRFSVDHDHVVADLVKDYDDALRALESIAGWRTHRRKRGLLVLGKVDGIGAGLRNLRRSEPLETIEVGVREGKSLCVPTVEEMLRIKAFLTVERNATRDYLDVAALSHHLGLRKSAASLDRLNELYSGVTADGSDVLNAAIVRLSAPTPYDLTEVDLSEYKGITKPWSDWSAVTDQCAELAAAVLKR